MKKVFALLSFVVLTSCDKKEVKNDGPVQGTSLSAAASLGTDVTFYPAERYSSNNVTGAPVLRFSFATKKIYPCLNYYLATTTFVRGNEMTIRFDSIRGSYVCLAAPGPAKCDLVIPGHIGSLILMNGNQKDRYSVKITDEIVELLKMDISFSDVSRSPLLRYPPNTVALICGTNVDKAHLPEAFARILIDSAGFTPYQFNSKGDIPYPKSSAGYGVNHATRFFKYKDQAAFIKSGLLLKNFKQQNISPNEGVSIYLVTWDNQYFRSWLL